MTLLGMGTGGTGHPMPPFPEGVKECRCSNLYSAELSLTLKWHTQGAAAVGNHTAEKVPSPTHLGHFLPQHSENEELGRWNRAWLRAS